MQTIESNGQQDQSFIKIKVANGLVSILSSKTGIDSKQLRRVKNGADAESLISAYVVAASVYSDLFPSFSDKIFLGKLLNQSPREVAAMAQREKELLKSSDTAAIKYKKLKQSVQATFMEIFPKTRFVVKGNSFEPATIIEIPDLLPHLDLIQRDEKGCPVLLDPSRYKIMQGLPLHVVIEGVQSGITEIFRIPAEVLGMKARQEEIVFARKMYYSILSKIYDGKLSLKMIGATINLFQNHATIIHALRSHQNLIDMSREHREQFSILENYLFGDGGTLYKLAIARTKSAL